MLRPNKIVIGISFLIMSYFIVALCLNVTSRIPSKVNHKASADIQVRPFHSGDVWGAKIETADKSRRFFAGIQKGANLDRDTDNYFPSRQKATIGGNIRNYQHYYELEFAGFDIRLKVLSYNQANPEDEGHDRPIAKKLNHLNYILKNRACKKCSKDNGILLGQADPSDLDTSVTKLTPKSIFAVIVQIEFR